jgi:hypothetical protein
MCVENAMQPRASLPALPKTSFPEVQILLLLPCAATPALQNAAKDRRNCIVAAATPDRARDYLTNGLDPPHAKPTECLAKAQSGGAAVGCLNVISVDY